MKEESLAHIVMWTKKRGGYVLCDPEEVFNDEESARNAAAKFNRMTLDPDVQYVVRTVPYGGGS